MRPDQVARLRDLSEKLADAFMLEADPQEWSGTNQPVSKMSTQERGDRYWCKKNAIATAAVLNATLLMIQRDPAAEGDDIDKDLDDEVKRAERAAEKAIKDARARSDAAAKR